MKKTMKKHKVLLIEEYWTCEGTWEFTYCVHLDRLPNSNDKIINANWGINPYINRPNEFLVQHLIYDEGANCYYAKSSYFLSDHIFDNAPKVEERIEAIKTARIGWRCNYTGTQKQDDRFGRT